jgi:hypothetical protein
MRNAFTGDKSQALKGEGDDAENPIRQRSFHSSQRFYYKTAERDNDPYMAKGNSHYSKIKNMIREENLK